MKRTSMTRDEQERWAVSYLAANLSKEESKDAECSITVQAFADFFAAQWPKTFNKMAFAAKVRAVAAHLSVPQAIGDNRGPKVLERLFTLPKFGQDHIR